MFSCTVCSVKLEAVRINIEGYVLEILLVLQGELAFIMCVM